MPPDPGEAMSARRLYPPQWRLACATLEAVLRAGAAADHRLHAAFREQRNMGSRDRAAVTALVYGVLRDLRRLQRIAGCSDANALCALQALESGYADVPHLAALGFAGAEAMAHRLRVFDPAALTPAERYNVPDAIYAYWQAELGADAAAALAQDLQRQAPVDLRVNALKATREQAQRALAASGLAAMPTPYAPLGLRLHRRVSLTALTAYRDGWIEPQDEGSQLLALLVAARPGERIVDYCAGAGGKTLALAAQMQDRGTLVAMDIDVGRLERLKPRLQRAGVRIVSLLPVDAAQVRVADFDAVLVDAPCSGTGTWRRQPEARLKALDLDALARQQYEILARAARLVRPGGRLVYATCSLLRAENDAVVERFCARHPDFLEEDAGAVLAAQGIALPGRRLRLYPHVHGTDGFFGACLRRR